MAKDYFKHSLPEHIFQTLDLDTLQPVEQTFIDDHWHKNITDVLFQVTAQGKPGYIYVLLEHMSTQDKWLPYRMLKYVMGVMKHHMDTTEKPECWLSLASYIRVSIPSDILWISWICLEIRKNWRNKSCLNLCI